MGVVLCAFGIIVHSCSQNDSCFEGIGTHTETRVETQAATTLSIFGIADIDFIEDTTNFCIIRGGKNIVKQVRISHADSCLSIHNYTECYMLKNQERPHITIHAQGIQTIYIEEACSFSTPTKITLPLHMYMNAYVADISLMLNTSEFMFTTWNKAGGVFNFSGTCTDAYLQANYTSQILAENLKINNCIFKHASIQNCTVWVTDTLTVETNKTGTLLYKGTPNVITKNNSLVQKME